MEEEDSISSATMCQSSETDRQPPYGQSAQKPAGPSWLFTALGGLAEESAVLSLSFPSHPTEVQMHFGLQPVLEHLCNQGCFLGLIPQRLLPSNPELLTLQPGPREGLWANGAAREGSTFPLYKPFQPSKEGGLQKEGTGSRALGHWPHSLCASCWSQAPAGLSVRNGVIGC